MLTKQLNCDRRLQTRAAARKIFSNLATCANDAELRSQIREAGDRPWQRDILYDYIDRSGIDYYQHININAAAQKLSVAFAD